MQPIEKQVTDEHEVVRLEKLWDEELKCEMDHIVTVCTTTATHRIFGCVPPVFMCTPAAEEKERRKLDRDCTCGLPAGECWRIEAI